VGSPGRLSPVKQTEELWAPLAIPLCVPRSNPAGWCPGCPGWSCCWWARRARDKE